jgi:hypothetical protein
MKNSPCSFFGGFLVFFKAVLAKPFVFVVVVSATFSVSTNGAFFIWVGVGGISVVACFFFGLLTHITAEFAVFAEVVVVFVSFLAAAGAGDNLAIATALVLLTYITSGAFFFFGLAFVVLRPVLLLVLAAFGTEGNSMLFAVIATFSPANLAWIAEFGLASFAFVLSVVVLGGLDVVKVRLCSHSDCLLDCCCPIYADKIISIFFGISENPRIIK